MSVSREELHTSVDEETQCGLVVASCICGEPKGHVEAGDEVHKCADHQFCKGQWIGDCEENFKGVVFPGGFTSIEEARAEVLRRALLGPVF